MTFFSRFLFDSTSQDSAPSAASLQTRGPVAGVPTEGVGAGVEASSFQQNPAITRVRNFMLFTSQFNHRRKPLNL